MMAWGLSPQELSNDSTRETNESRFLSSPKLDEESEIFHPYRKCKFVDNEKQLSDVRDRVTKTNFASLD